MRKLILKMSMTVDGFVAGPNGELEWLFADQDRAADEWTVNMIWQAGAHLMGSRTFYDMAGWWPSATDNFAAPMNEIPKVVFSKDPQVTSKSKWTPTQASADASKADAGTRAPASVTTANEKSWLEARVMSGDLAENIAQLKREPGKDLLAHGGVSFARSLLRLGLVDELSLATHPVAIGRGQSIFSELPRATRLELVSAMTFSKGVVAHVYRVKGAE